MRGLKGKVAVVTGAGRGIGRAIAENLASHDVRLVIADKNDDQLKQLKDELSSSVQVEAMTADVTERAEVEALMTRALAAFGGIDILVNNAGIARFEPFLDICDASWNAVLDVNLNGVFICSQVAAREMRARGGGAIVNVASTNGLLGEPMQAHYNASKAGVVLLSKSMAIELAPYGIRVNSVCPGFILTDLAREAGMSDSGIEEYAAKIPMGRNGRPEEVAEAVAFLASESSSFVTGSELVVDGGQICQE